VTEGSAQYCYVAAPLEVARGSGSPVNSVVIE
jgi:hypothetical protein